MGLKKSKFVEVLQKFAAVGLDSVLLIYHLEDIEPYSELTEATFVAISEGSLRAVLSTIVATELLVKPFGTGQEDRVAAFEHFLFSLPNTTLISPSCLIAKEAARLRARYGLRTPDALHVATTLSEKAGAFLTNDTRLRKLKTEGIAVVILDDYI